MNDLLNKIYEVIVNLLKSGLFIAFIILILRIIFIRQNRSARQKDYLETEYYAITKNQFQDLINDDGLYGEYLIYKCLCKLPGYKKFLFNCYIPKTDGTTSETDVIMLHTSGIYVFESKNYSGWIFGTETQRNWTQAFPNGHKERFYNPVMQNNTHIYHLKRFLPEISGDVFQSVIVFSEKCTLKEIEMTSENHIVTQLHRLNSVISEKNSTQIISGEKIDEIYSKLYPLTQVSDDVKLAHIETVSSRIYN